MDTDLIPFHAGLLPEAAMLLAARHAGDRRAFPALPASGADPANARAALDAAWARPFASGAAAVRAGHLVGYLIADLTFDTLRGRTAWVRQAGQALAPGQDPDLLRDLYAAAAPRWVALGCFDHFVLLPPSDPAVIDRWFHLSFGLEQIHGFAYLDAVDLTAPPLAPDITLRQAIAADAHHLAALSQVIRRHQAAAPVWGAALPEHTPEARSGYAGLVTDPDATVWLALRGDEPLGFQAYFTTAPAPADLLIPTHCLELSIGGTVPAARGLGVARALTAHAFAAARAAGYRTILADWRSTNLLASRFWPRQGFVPVLYRLIRRVDDRALWATGE